MSLQSGLYLLQWNPHVGLDNKVNGFSWAPSNQAFSFAACTSNGKVCIFQGILNDY